MAAIETITDDLLIKAIERASQRVVFVAPSVWPDLAEAIAAAWRRIGPEAVSVILDVDAEVYRLGYGSEEGLGILQNAAKEANQSLGHQPGVRICILIADNETFVFSPTARLIENSPPPSPDLDTNEDLFDRQPEKPGVSKPAKPSRPNGIVIKGGIESVAKELGAGKEGILDRKIGLKAVDSATVDAVKKDLEANPPKEFDLAKAVNVYNARIRFVELEAKGYRISKHKVVLPKNLVQVVKEDSKLSGKIDAALHLIGEGDNLVKNGASEQTVEKIRKQIDKQFLRSIPGIGTILLRSEIPQFEKMMTELKDELNAFSKNISESLRARFIETAEDLSEELLPSVMENIPQPWKRYLRPKPEPQEVKFKIKETLLRSFGDPEKRIARITAKCIYKDVTYDMLKDQGFAQQVAEHFPDIKQFEEYAAAAERKSSQKES